METHVTYSLYHKQYTNTQVISGIRRDMNNEIIGFMGRYVGLESGWCRHFGNSYWFFLHRLNDQRRSTIIHPVTCDP